MSPNQFFKRSVVVTGFPEEFVQVEMDSLRLADGSPYDGKASSERETVASLFGLLAVMLRQNLDKSTLREDGTLSQLKKLVNAIDFSPISSECAREATCSDSDRPRAARRLAMPSTPVQDASNEITSANPVQMQRSNQRTPSSSGLAKPVKSSPNLKEICENTDIDTPEKAMMVEKRGKVVIGDINEVCNRHRESLSTVLSFLCAFGDEEAKAVLNDVVEQVSVKKGVKRAVEDLVGEETYSKYVARLRVPDWVLLYFKTKGRISGNTWQSVLNITSLGRTGVTVTCLCFVFRGFFLCS